MRIVTSDNKYVLKYNEGPEVEPSSKFELACILNSDHVILGGNVYYIKETYAEHSFPFSKVFTYSITLAFIAFITSWLIADTEYVIKYLTCTVFLASLFKYYERYLNDNLKVTRYNSSTLTVPGERRNGRKQKLL